MQEGVIRCETPKCIGLLRFICHYGQRRKGAGISKEIGDLQVVEESRTPKACKFLLDNPEMVGVRGCSSEQPPLGALLSTVLDSN